MRNVAGQWCFIKLYGGVNHPGLTSQTTEEQPARLPFGSPSASLILLLRCRGHILTPLQTICHKKVTMRAEIGATAAPRKTGFLILWLLFSLPRLKAAD